MGLGKWASNTWDQITGQDDTVEGPPLPDGDEAKKAEARRLAQEQANAVKLANRKPGEYVLPDSGPIQGLMQGMEVGRTKGEQAYGNLAELGQKNQAQISRMGDLSKGYSGEELGALRSQARQSAQSAQARGNIQAGAQGLKGGAAQKSSRNVANNMGQMEASMALDNGSIIRSGTKDYMNVLQSGISNINKQSIAEAGLVSNVIAGKEIAGIQPPQGGNGTLTCVALFASGMMSDELFASDQVWGATMEQNDHRAYYGYAMVAVYAVLLMKKSELFKKMVAKITIPVVSHATGYKKNILGAIILKLGLPLCRGVYGIRIKKSNC